MQSLRSGGEVSWAQMDKKKEIWLEIDNEGQGAGEESSVFVKIP